MQTFLDSSEAELSIQYFIFQFVTSFASSLLGEVGSELVPRLDGVLAVRAPAARLTGGAERSGGACADRSAMF